MRSRHRPGLKSFKSKSNGAGKPKRTKTGSHAVISQPKNCDAEKLECNERPADAVKEKSTLLIPQTGPLPVYIIPLSEQHFNANGCKRFSFGKESTKPNRTIMVLGAAGAGKSTLINGMINYVLGVEWEDSYRFQLVDEGQSKSQAESHNSEVTVYKINHQEGFRVDYSLTIIDTPNFGDKRGIRTDQEITEQLRNLFSAEHGVSEIDAVCFVAQAALAQLTPSQKYMFHSVVSIFGKDVADNIRVLVTCADGQQPPVLEAISASGVPCPRTKRGLPVHFKFNNSALFADSKASAADSMSDEDESFDKMFWNMGTESMKMFFVALNIIETKSLTMTREVLRERWRLETAVENHQKQVQLESAKLEELKIKKKTLNKHEAEIRRYEKFELESTVQEAIQVDISGAGMYLNNCKQCYYTCHCPCRRSNIVGDIRHCCAMASDGYCTVCPGKCYWNEHVNQKQKWEYKEVKEIKIVKELKKKFLIATEARKHVQALIEKLMNEYKPIQAEVDKLKASCAKCLSRLQEITLNPNSLYSAEYIDMLIEGEKSEAKPGWKQRVQPLIAMREFMAKVDRGEILLQSPLTDFHGYNQGQTQNNANQSQTNSNTSHSNTETNTKRPRLE